MREGTECKFWCKNRLGVGGWLRRKAGDRKEMYMVFAGIEMGGGLREAPRGALGHK